MPWSDQGGTNENGSQSPRGPWGHSPSGSGSTPPGLQDHLRRGVSRLREILPRSVFTRRSLAFIGSAALLLWLLSGIYFVNAGQRCIVLRLGAVSATTGPGMHYSLPWPVEVIYKSNIDKANWVNVGFQIEEDSSQASSDVPEESHMLTADGNIVDVNFTVNWQIVDMPAYLFAVPHSQESTIKAVAESTMREVVSQSRFERIQTVDRGRIQSRVRDMMQKVVDGYGMGIQITGVKLLKTDFPVEATGAGHEMQEARAEGERLRSEAEQSAGALIPKARGEADRVVEDAQAYRQKTIAEAGGEAQRFLAILAEYRKAPDITRRRIYLETMSRILGPVNKVIVDGSVKGAVANFQLPPLQKAAPPPAQPARP
ncbi:MAG TPA: FtsH protease activity modulator HflK, partial [Rhizomicrobium sp.]|nr:FtsH protease activity modulator HflK [Rhizomicrobium sp.]